jgi:hypothetical protein
MPAISQYPGSKIIRISFCRQYKVCYSFNDIGRRKKQKKYYFIFGATGKQVIIGRSNICKMNRTSCLYNFIEN